MNLSEADIKAMFSEIKEILEKQGIKAQDSEIKYTMKILTQYANLNALEKVDKLLPKDCYEKYFSTNGCSLADFMYILDSKKETFGNTS